MRFIRYLHNFNWLFLEKIIRIMGGLFVGIWVAKYLGPHDFGIFSYALAFIAFFSWTSHLGLNQIVVREMVKYPEQEPKILGSAFVMKLTGALIGLGLISICIHLMKPEDGLTRLVVYIISFTYVFQSFDVLEFYFQAKVISKQTMIAKTVAFITSSFIKVYLIISGCSVAYFALANVIDMLVAGVLMAFLYHQLGNQFKFWLFDIKMAVNLLTSSWPIMIGSFLITIHLKTDQIMIDQFLDLSQVGLYSVAVRLAESWYFLPTIVVSTLIPYFFELRDKDNRLYHYRLVQLYFAMFWLGFGVAVATQLVGERVIVLLFGEAYRNSFKALALNIWAGVFVAQSLAKGIWDISEDLQIYRIILHAVAICINVIGNLILIPMYGIVGAAFATLLTRVSTNWITPIFIKPYRANNVESIKAINPFYLLKMKRGL